MDALNLQLLVIVGAGLFLAFTRVGRIIVGVGAVLGVVWLLSNLLVRKHACPPGPDPCSIDLQRVAVGPCFADEGLITVNGRYHLTAPAGQGASATCVSLEVWR